MRINLPVRLLGSTAVPLMSKITSDAGLSDTYNLALGLEVMLGFRRGAAWATGGLYVIYILRITHAELFSGRAYPLATHKRLARWANFCFRLGITRGFFRVQRHAAIYL